MQQKNINENNVFIEWKKMFYKIGFIWRPNDEIFWEEWEGDQIQGEVNRKMDS